MNDAFVSVTLTIICVLIVLVFATVYQIESIQIFALPMLVGMISGCYSTICVAGAVWVTWKERRK